MIQAITNQQVGLKYVIIHHQIFKYQKANMNFSVITELIIGYALPGNPLAMMLFKTWGYMVCLSRPRYYLPLALLNIDPPLADHDSST